MVALVDYPIRWYSRILSESQGTAPNSLYLLSHADRALVSGGTVYVDHSTYNQSVAFLGTGIVQSTGAAFYGTSGIVFTGSTATADAARIVWNMPTITATTATEARPALGIESILKFNTLSTSTVYVWWDIGSTVARSDYGEAFFVHNGTDWLIRVNWFRTAVGMYLSRDWKCVSLTTASWHHFALVREDGSLTGSRRVTVFQNGSQLELVAGGNPTGGSGHWSDVAGNFTGPQGTHFAWGGQVASFGGTGNSFRPFAGYMDEMRFIFDSLHDGVVYTSVTSVYTFSVPTAAYPPLDVTSTSGALTMALNSTTLFCTTDGGLNLGSSSSQWNDLFVTGTAYIDAIGENLPILGTARVIFNSTTVNSYILSSAAGFLTLVAGTQIDLQANIGVSAKNFIFDTATGVKFGTTTNVKMAFFGSSPVVQQTGNIVAALSNLGLVVNGTLGISFTATVTTTSAAYTLTTADEYLVCESGTSFAVTFPFAVAGSHEFMVKNIGAGTVTLTANTIDRLDGGTTIALAQWEKSRLFDYRAATGDVNTYTALLLHFDGVDASTVFEDGSPYQHSLVSQGTAEIDTAQSQFGGASGLFDNTDSFLSLPYHSVFAFGSKNFTFECWIRLAATGSNAIFSQVAGSAHYMYWAFEGTGLRFRDFTGVNNIDFTRTPTINVNSWHHLAVTRSGATFYMHVDGMITGATYTNANSITARTDSLDIGGLAGPGAYIFNGWIDEMRWDIGIARYTTASFSVATAAYTNATSGLWITIH